MRDRERFLEQVFITSTNVLHLFLEVLRFICLAFGFLCVFRFVTVCMCVRLVGVLFGFCVDRVTFNDVLWLPFISTFFDHFSYSTHSHILWLASNNNAK